jgi:transposase
VVTEWATRRRRAEKADADNLQRIPSSRTIARMMTFGRSNLSKAEAVTVTAIETGVPGLVEARERIAEFQAMVRDKTDADLATWIAAARASLVASFASGVAKDEPAVRAAIIDADVEGAALVHQGNPDVAQRLLDLERHHVG